MEYEEEKYRNKGHYYLKDILIFISPFIKYIYEIDTVDFFFSLYTISIDFSLDKSIKSFVSYNLVGVNYIMLIHTH